MFPSVIDERSHDSREQVEMNSDGSLGEDGGPSLASLLRRQPGFWWEKKAIGKRKRWVRPW